MAPLPLKEATTAKSTVPRIFILREAADAAALERNAAAELLERWAAKQNHKSNMSATRALRLAARSIRAGHHRRGIATAARAAGAAK